MSIISDTTTQEYVEIIHELQKQNKVARVKDIAKRRGVSRSSVSTVLNLLKKRNLVIHEQYGLVELTSTGEQLGEILAHRHEAIYKFLTEILGVKAKIADQDACKLEHYISPETVKKLIDFLEFIHKHSDDEFQWITKFQDNRRNNKAIDKN